MIVYNTIVGLAAGVALLLIAELLRKLGNSEARREGAGFLQIDGKAGDHD